MKKIVITGATGFLGKELLKQLDREDLEIVILARKIDSSIKLKAKTHWILGDITQPDILHDDQQKKLLLDADTVLHAAAYYDLKGTYNDCFLSNVVGTRNLLNFFKSAKKLKSFHYISTIAVIDPVGNENILEDILPERNKFTDYYSQTKYSAEKMFRDFEFTEPNVAKLIYRPGVIVCASDDPKNYKEDGPYYFAKVLKKFRPILNFIPHLILSFDAKASLPIVPVDHVAKFLVKSLNRKSFSPELKEKSRTYHLVSDGLPTIPVFLEQILNELRINIGLKNTDINIINNQILTKIGIPKETIPFMFHRHSYDKSNCYKDFEGGFESQYKDFQVVLLKSLRDV